MKVALNPAQLQHNDVDFEIYAVANKVNSRLINMCKERNIPYIDHVDTISPERHLNESNLHLTRYGLLASANSFSKYLLELD